MRKCIPSNGPEGQQEGCDGRQLTGVAVAKVGPNLHKLAHNNHGDVDGLSVP